MQNTIQVSFKAEDLKSLLNTPQCEAVIIKLVLQAPLDFKSGEMVISASPLLPSDTDAKTKKAKTNLVSISAAKGSVSGCPYPPGCHS